MQHQPLEPKSDADPEIVAPDASSQPQPAELSDEELQAEYRRRHLEQLRRFQCPGCGESEIF